MPATTVPSHTISPQFLGVKSFTVLMCPFPGCLVDLIPKDALLSVVPIAMPQSSIDSMNSTKRPDDIFKRIEVPI